MKHGWFFFTLISFSLAAQAQNSRETTSQPSSAQPDPLLETVVVIAHRQPRPISQVAGTVTVIDAEEMRYNITLDATDLVRYQAGVDMGSNHTRFGFDGFRIRGIGGNRTAIVIDNVPLPDSFSVGNFANSGRGLLELGLADKVEILRGPASTLYGSKALGGVVAISLLDAQRLLDAGGTRLSVTGATDADRYRLLAANAGEAGDFSYLAAGAHLSASEVDVAERPDTTPMDLLDREQNAVLLRGTLDTWPGPLRLSLDAARETRRSDIRAMIGSGRLANTEQLLGDDTREHWRLVLDQQITLRRHNTQGQWRLWHQATDTRQLTHEERPGAATPVNIDRRFEYEHNSTGLGADLETQVNTGALAHRLGYGFEITRAAVSNLRDGLQTNRNTGETTKVIIGERFPLRDFPNSHIDELGIYLHDEIRLWPEGPSLSPGLRYERYKLSLRDDPLFERAFPEAELTTINTSAWLPKLGLLWPMGKHAEFFAQYAEGFRAPPFADVNIGLEYAQFNVRAIPNPDLKPERGRTLEAGLRWRGAHTQVEFAVYHNRYRDFIQTRAPLGPDPETGWLLFQSINRDRIHMEGVELRWEQRLGAGFSTTVSAWWSRARDKTRDSELAGVAPPGAHLTLAYLSPSAAWETRLITTVVKGQRESLDGEGNPLFAAPGYATVDWLLNLFPREGLELSLGVFNITDRQYWRASHTENRPLSDPTLPLLAEPGRYFGLGVTWHP